MTRLLRQRAVASLPFTGRRLWRDFLAGAMTAVLVAAALPSPVSAANWGALDAAHRCTSNDPLSQCTTQDFFLKVMTEFLDTFQLQVAMSDRLENVYDPVPEIRAEVTDSFAEDDAQAFDGSYGLNGNRAWTTCSAGATKGGAGIEMWCHPQYIYFNNGSYPLNYDAPEERLRIACHEIGHVFGLRHATAANHGAPGSTCMKAWPMNSALLHQHDKDHLTLEY